MTRKGKGRDVRDRLKDIIESIDDVVSFTSGMTYEDFAATPKADRKSYLAVRGAFIQMGEAIKALPPEMRLRNRHIRWEGIAGMRDIVVHHYHRIDTDIFWEVITLGELAELRAVVEAELNP